MAVDFLQSFQDFAYTIYPTRRDVYDDFPFQSVMLKSGATGGYVPANFVQLTRGMAFFQIDRIWWRFPGPFAPGSSLSPEDNHWKWTRYVRKLRRESPYLRCVAVRTEDGNVQGAAIYRQAAQSRRDQGERAAYVYNLAVAPRCRRGFAAVPVYLGVGEALMILIVAHSYEWGYGGRVVLDSLPGAVNFYRRLGFVETPAADSRMIDMGLKPLELTPRAATKLLEGKGVI